MRSVGRSRYFVTFIDDASHFRWIYFMEFKNEIYQIFKKFIMMTKNQFEKTVKAVRSDNGAEYLSLEFQTILNEFGILHERTIIYFPQQNGVAERLNRTLMDLTRTMLIPIPNLTYVLNRSNNQKLKDIPYKSIRGRNLEIKDLRIFGSKVIKQVPVEKRKKLDNHGEPGFFVGYDNQEDGYRIFLLKKNVVTRSRDVVFFENEFYNGGTVDEENQEVSVGTNQLALFSINEFPESFQEALNDEASKEWKSAMDSEYSSLMNNGTWRLTPRPKGRNVITGKWVFTIKKDSDGNIIRYKARWVARGFTQIKGVDYSNVFAPPARNTTIRIIISLIVQRNMRCKQFDVETSFLNGRINEDIYMEQPVGYAKNDLVCKLEKAIYGLKQAGREWTC